jgi:hypothetical protein
MGPCIRRHRRCLPASLADLNLKTGTDLGENKKFDVALKNRDSYQIITPPTQSVITNDGSSNWEIKDDVW